MLFQHSKSAKQIISGNIKNAHKAIENPNRYTNNNNSVDDVTS
jgi:hypothetical protein